MWSVESGVRTEQNRTEQNGTERNGNGTEQNGTGTERNRTCDEMKRPLRIGCSLLEEGIIVYWDDSREFEVLAGLRQPLKEVSARQSMSGRRFEAEASVVRIRNSAGKGKCKG